MADFTYKTGDTDPPLVFTCAFSDGTIKDLTGGSASLSMWRAGSRGTPLIDDAAMTIVGAGTNGTVSYAWGATDLSAEGVYHFEAHTTDAAGKKTTFPNGSYGVIVVYAREAT